MAKFDLKTYALQGARSRAEELESELREIYRVFPGLRVGRASRKTGNRTTAVRRRRSRMTAAQRKAVSARMKKYWAERRKTAK